MVLQSDLMYRPTDAVFRAGALYVCEELNHRVSKWNFGNQFYDFSLSSGNGGNFSDAVAGTNYTFDVVTFTGGSPSTAAEGRAIINAAGAVEKIIITELGNGYSGSPPAVAVSNGTGEDLTANITAERITSVTINDGGMNFNPSPTVIIPPPDNPDPNIVQKQALAIVLGKVDGTEIAGYAYSDFGSGYLPQTFALVVEGGTGENATVNANFIAAWGNNNDGTTGKPGAVVGPLDNNLDHPCGITADGNRVYLTDTNHNRVRTLSLTTGQFLGSVGTGGTGPSLTTFNKPSGIDVNFVGTTVILIADKLNQRVMAYDTADTPVNPQKLPDPTEEPGNIPFHTPVGVTHDRNDDMIYVSDLVNGNLTPFAHISPFTPGLQIGQPSATPGDNNLYRPGSGKSIDTKLDVFIANTHSDSVKEIVVNPPPLAILKQVPALSTPGLKLGQLAHPNSISQASAFSNYLAVVNTLSNRIDMYEIVGNDTFVLRSTFGSPTPIPA